MPGWRAGILAASVRGVRCVVVPFARYGGAAMKTVRFGGAGPNEQGLSWRHVIAACEAILRRLGTDYLNLYQVRQPDPETPIAETLGALDDPVRAGKVRYIGCSNYPAWRLGEALATSERERLARFASVQPHRPG